MAKPIRRALLLALFLFPPPARAHSGPPFPILVDQRVGPYVASVWTDPDIGTGTFFVTLEPGQSLPAAVRIGVQPVTRRLPEVLYKAEPQAVKEGARYFTQVKFDQGGMWHTRVLIDGPAGGGELKADVEPTPDGIIGPFASLVYVLPFLGIGFLWIKAALRRRAPAAAPR